MNQPDERDIFVKIKTGNEKSYESLFHKYYGLLCGHALKITGDKNAAEEIVQDFFVKLWEKREQLAIDTSVNNYLYRSVKNQCINYLQHQKIIQKHTLEVLRNSDNQEAEVSDFWEPGIIEKIEETIESMPGKRKEIFRLSRQEGLKYHEIADKLNISVKTVETHMSLAIKSLREKLKKFQFLFTFL